METIWLGGAVSGSWRDLKPRWTEEVRLEELCEKEETIQFFDQNLEKMTDCSELCSKLHEEGRMPSITTEQEVETLASKMEGNFIDSMWAPMIKTPNGSKG